MPPLMRRAILVQAGMPVDLQVADGITAALQIDELQSCLTLIAQHTEQQLSGAELCVRICDEEESRLLNHTYRGIDKSTNVLSFAADMDVPEMQVLGDLAICWPVLQREAAAQHKPLQHHFMHLFVHGVLHLLGFDHEQSQQAALMEKLEVQILRELGVGNPYEPAAG